MLLAALFSITIQITWLQRAGAALPAHGWLALSTAAVVGEGFGLAVVGAGLVEAGADAVWVAGAVADFVAVAFAVAVVLLGVGDWLGPAGEAAVEAGGWLVAAGAPDGWVAADGDGDDEQPASTTAVAARPTSVRAGRPARGDIRP